MFSSAMLGSRSHRASRVTQQAAQPCCCPWLQLWPPPEAQGSCSTTTPPSSSVSHWNFLQGPLQSRFSPSFVPCSFRDAAFVSTCLHWAALHTLSTSSCNELCLYNARIRDANFCKWEMFSNIMYTVYFCGDQRIWQCYTAMTLFQLWKFKNSLKYCQLCI